MSQQQLHLVNRVSYEAEPRMKLFITLIFLKAYDVNRETDGSDHNVVIFDLGGSVTNVSIITFEEKILDVSCV